MYVCIRTKLIYSVLGTNIPENCDKFYICTYNMSYVQELRFLCHAHVCFIVH